MWMTIQLCHVEKDKEIESNEHIEARCLYRQSTSTLIRAADLIHMWIHLHVVGPTDMSEVDS
jgi:hypothetical protein